MRCFSACAPFSHIGKEVKDTAENVETAYEGTTTEDVMETTIDLYESVDYTDDLSDEAKAICGEYFKSGNASYEISIRPVNIRSGNTLEVSVDKRIKDAVFFTGVLSFEISFSEGSTEYMVYDLSPCDRVGERYKLDVSEASSGKIVLSYAPLNNSAEKSEEYANDEAYAKKDPLEGCGEYYSSDMLLMSYSLDRPLNRADIIGMTTGELKILRNQFYALYGRAFDTESMRDYFSGKPWYRALISPSEFDDSVFSLLEKRNIEFLKAIEAEYSEEPEYYEKKAKEEREALDALEEAPYKELLTSHGEIYLEIYSDPQNAEDKGIYYEANGRIALPVSVTSEQYIEVIENNGEAEVIINELTAETRIMRKCENPDYGDCILCDPYDSSDEGMPYFLAYKPYSGKYTFWENSADTIFKDVYSGKIYVMKGAEEEYIYNFSAQRDINDEDWGAGSWRRMDFDETDINMTSAYWGNSPVFNKKGYLVGLYWWGD